MNQQKWWEKAWQFLRKSDNALTVITLVIGVILAVIGIRGGDTNLVLMSIVAILGGLAAAQLISNYQTLEYPERLDRMEKLEEEIASGIKSLAVPSGLVLRDRTDMPRLDSYIGQAREVFLAGRTLLSAVSQYQDFWKEIMGKGCNLRFILVNPEIFGVENLQNNMGVSFAICSFDSIGSLNRLKGFKNIYNNKLEIRLINYIPELILLMVDGEQSNGKIRVELSPYKSDVTSYSHFELTATNNPRWYEVFRKACEQMWEEATPWQG